MGYGLHQQITEAHFHETFPANSRPPGWNTRQKANGPRSNEDMQLRIFYPSNRTFLPSVYGHSES